MGVYYSKVRSSWYICVSHKGKRHFCYSSDGRSFKRKADACRYEPAFCASLFSKGDDVLCTDLFPSFYRFLSDGLKGSTFYNEKSLFESNVEPFFFRVKVGSIDRLFLDRFSERLAEGRRLAFKGHLYSVANKWLLFLSRYNPVCVPNLRDRRSAVKPSRDYSFYTYPQFLLLYKALDSSKYRLLFSVLFFYGLRIGECLALRWSDFRPDGLDVSKSMCFKSFAGRQTVTTPKTSSSIRFLPRIAFVYSQLPRRHGPGFVFSGQKGKCIGESTVRRALAFYSKKAGLPLIRIHDFRHSCATWLISSGVPVRNVSKWLGHSSEAITLKVYSHLLPSEKDVVSDFINLNTKSLDP